MELNFKDHFEHWEKWFEDLSGGTWDFWNWNCSCIGPVHINGCDALCGLWCSASIQVERTDKRIIQLEQENAELHARSVAAEADRKSIRAELDIKQTKWADSNLNSAKLIVAAWAERDDFKARLERKRKEWAESALTFTKMTEKAQKDFNQRRASLPKLTRSLSDCACW